MHCDFVHPVGDDHEDQIWIRNLSIVTSDGAFDTDCVSGGDQVAEHGWIMDPRDIKDNWTDYGHFRRHGWKAEYGCLHNGSCVYVGNWTDETSDFLDDFKIEFGTINILILFIGCFISLLTILGNSTVLFVFIKNKNLRTTTNYFIISLSIADLFVGCFSIPFLTYRIISSSLWPFSHLSCDIIQAFNLFSMKTSVFNLLLMTVDRFTSITRPLMSRVYRTKYNTLTSIIVFWVVSFIYNFSLVLGWEQDGGLRDKYEKYSYCHVEYTEDITLTIISVTLGYFLPVIIMCSLYTIIWRHVRQRRRKMSSFREGQDMVMEIKRSKRRLVTQKATRTIAIIVLVFIVTCLPNTMMLIVFMLTRQTSTSLLVMHSIGQGLQCLNSTLNPLCYALSNPAFRSSFKLMLSGSQKHQRMRMRNISFSTGGQETRITQF